MPAARYAIVTPYWNEERWLIERCIRSVREQSLPADHILVADGRPEDWIDEESVRHIRLDRNHDDFGNTPRGIGALLAITERYDGIGFLDADNWFEPGHVAACVRGATARGWDYVIARRHLRRPDGSIIDVEDDEVTEHVDTSCFFMLPSSYRMIPYFWMPPRELSPICDRVFFAALQEHRLKAGVLAAKTVNYHCLWRSVYQRAGETPPPQAKADVDWAGLRAWLDSRSPDELEEVYRLCGSRLRFVPKPEPRTAPSATAVASYATGAANMIHQITLPSGEKVPALGQGTWKMAERGSDAQDIKSLRLGIELGLTLIDTAEMYGEGRVESLVAEAIAGQRDRVFLVSKVYPHNADKKGIVAACNRSLKRLKTDRLDLYLLHWRGSVPLRETIAGFEELKRAGKIRHWGVSNLDTADMQELFAAGGTACATNQILYNLQRRGPEAELIPWLTARRIPVMAYSPFEQGRLTIRKPLADMARARDMQPYQIALAWLLHRTDTIVIPKTGSEAHLRANREAADVELSAEELAALDAAYPPPRGKKPPLATL